MNTPTVTSDGTVWDRTFRYVPSGAYKVQALETFMTSMAVVHVDLKMKSELPAGSPTVDACGVLADDGLLSKPLWKTRIHRIILPPRSLCLPVHG